MANLFNVDNVHETLKLPFPASTKQAAGIVSGVLTDVMSVSFCDKILVIISQKGRLSHWVSIDQSQGSNLEATCYWQTAIAPGTFRKHQSGDHRFSYFFVWSKWRQSVTSNRPHGYNFARWSCSWPWYTGPTLCAADCQRHYNENSAWKTSTCGGFGAIHLWAR